VEEGTLTLRSAGALGPQAIVTTDSGGVIEIDGVTGGAGELEPFGTGINGTGALRGLAGNNTWAGTVGFQFASSVGVDAGGVLTLSGRMFGGGNVTKVGGGGLTLAGDGHNFAGTLTLADGTLLVNGTLGGPVVVNAGTLGGTGTVAGIHAFG